MASIKAPESSVLHYPVLSPTSVDAVGGPAMAPSATCRLSTILSLVGEGALVWVWTRGGARADVSPELRRWTGLEPDEPLHAAVHPNDRRALFVELEDAARRWPARKDADASSTPTPPRVDRKYRVRVAGGGWRWVHESASAFLEPDASGRLARIGGFVAFVSDAHQEVEAEYHLENLSAFAPMVLLLKCNALSGRILWSSRPGEAEDGSRWQDLVHPADLPGALAQVEEVLAPRMAAARGEGDDYESVLARQYEDLCLVNDNVDVNRLAADLPTPVAVPTAPTTTSEETYYMCRILMADGSYATYGCQWRLDQDGNLYIAAVSRVREAATDFQAFILGIRLDAALKACNGGLFCVDNEKKKAYVGPELGRIYGFPEKHDVFKGGMEGLDMLAAMRIPEDAKDQLLRQWDDHNVGTEELTVTWDYRIARYDTGEVRWLRNLCVFYPMTSAGQARHKRETAAAGKWWPMPHGRQVVIIFDVTEEKAAAAQLRRALDAATAASKAKSFFVANMSHEIRTPLNAVLGCGALLSHTTLTTEQTDLVNTIQCAGEGLMGVLNDILDFTKIDAGKMTIELAPLSVKELVEGVVSQLRHLAEAKNLVLSFSLDPQIPPVMLGDSVRLRQVLVNLCGNGIKFTREGFVHLSVALADDDATERDAATGGQAPTATLRFTVTDSGMGVPCDRRHLLFATFSQMSTSITRVHGGSGLGLAICSQLARLMSGSVRHEDRPGGGSVFVFEVPLVTAEEEPPALDSPDGNHYIGLRLQDQRTTGGLPIEDTDPWASASCAVTGGVLSEGALSAIIKDDGPEPRKRGAALVPIAAPRETGGSLVAAEDTTPRSSEPRLLVVDDNAVNLRVIAHMLRKFGGYQELTFASNGQQAVDLVAKEHFDVVLLDLWMPVMDGATAASIITSKYPAKHRPVIVAVTAAASVEVRESCQQAGMDFFLAKPVKSDQLKAVMEHSIQLAQQRQRCP